MTRMPTLVPIAFAVFTATADAQVPDSLAEAGYRDGRAAAGARQVVGYAALGFVTGFAAGFAGIPLLILGEGEQRLLGVVLTFPLVATLAGTGAARASPPADIAERIQSRPAAYQQAFRFAYGERFAQRRQRAAVIGAVGGGVTGLAAIVALVVSAFSHLE
jgi:hypothetical protein